MLQDRQIEITRRHTQPRLSSATMLVSVMVLSGGASAWAKDLSDSQRFLQMSHTIFKGRVVSSNSFFNSETGDILTRFLFQVDETLKGPESGQIEIIEYGGAIEGLTMVAPHGAKYRLDAEYLVFVWRDDLRRERTLGGDQGALPLVLDGTGEAAVRLAPNHPLRSLLPNGKGILIDFRSLSQAIHKAGESGVRHEK